MQAEPRIWAIALIDPKIFMEIEPQFHRLKFTDVKVCVPKITVIRKQFRGKTYTEDRPLLFNYGFINMSLRQSFNGDLLRQWKDEISGLSNWFYSSTYKIDRPLVNSVTEEEINRLLRVSRNFSIFSKEDMENIKVGSVIELHGYPFENLLVEITYLNLKDRRVKGKLIEGGILQDIDIDFENIFYSIYKDYDDSLTNALNIDELLFTNSKRLKYAKD